MGDADRLARTPAPPRPPIAWSPLLGVSAALVAVLIALSVRYGYHRDELYFLAAGDRPAWGYPDQPPVVPLLARALDTVAPGSLVALRLPSAFAAGVAAMLTGMIARELGGRRSAQALAALCMAVSALLLAVGHLLSTSTFDLLTRTALSYVVVRILLRGQPRLWLLVGALAGLGMQVKYLPAFLLVALGVGVLATGPRRVLRSPYLWLGAALALVLWSPNLVWQASNGWPQLELSRAIASGSSGTSEPRWLFVPYQCVLVSPLLVPVWVAGLVRLARDPALPPLRCLAVAYGVLVVLFIVTGGKPYYLGGLFPLLLAAGAEPTLRWVRRGRPMLRRTLLGAAAGLGAAVNVVLMLPVLPATVVGDTPVVDINYDAGETIGWPAFTASVAAAYDSLPPQEQSTTVVVTQNYSEAGAVDRYGQALGLPGAYSGHNSYALWGPPPDTGGPTIAVGIPEDVLMRYFGSVKQVGVIDNGVGVENDEQGRQVWVCRDQLVSWDDAWPELRRLA